MRLKYQHLYSSVQHTNCLATCTAISWGFAVDHSIQCTFVEMQAHINKGFSFYFRVLELTKRLWLTFSVLGVTRFVSNIYIIFIYTCNRSRSCAQNPSGSCKLLLNSVQILCRRVHHTGSTTGSITGSGTGSGKGSSTGSATGSSKGPGTAPGKGIVIGTLHRDPVQDLAEAPAHDLAQDPVELL